MGRRTRPTAITIRLLQQLGRKYQWYFRKSKSKLLVVIGRFKHCSAVKRKYLHIASVENYWGLLAGDPVKAFISYEDIVHPLKRCVEIRCPRKFIYENWKVGATRGGKNPRHDWRATSPIGGHG